MSDKGKDTSAGPDPGMICFGLSPELDRQSLASYLQLLGHVELSTTLAARMSSAEIEELIDLIGALMRQHLSKKEYHHLFLGQGAAHDQAD